MTQRKCPRRAFVPRSGRRRGAVMVAVLVCLAVAGVVYVALLQTVATERRAMVARQERLQAVWLADSGTARAVAQLALSPDYKGETWKLSAENLGAPDGAAVTIEIQSVPEKPSQRLVRVRAEYGPAAEPRARHTQETLLGLPVSQEVKNEK
ncbi:MAG: hypothetical protein ACYC35_17490 [Pirellulales bacterium]